MKVHYINILLFAHALNILAHNNKNKPYSTQHTQTTRLLCECELYAPANYDNDTEMKTVMDNFNKQTQQRFHEYDERLQEKRKKCKERCDKEIQKIILKDKLEKQMAQQLTTLDTNITTENIPTCICEKSIADKVEKGCLRCGEILGTAAPEFGLIGGNFVYAAAVNAATEAGMEAAIGGLREVNGLQMLLQEKITYLVTPKNFNCPDALVTLVQNVKATQCVGEASKSQIFCEVIDKQWVSKIYPKTVQAARDGAEAYFTALSDSPTIVSFLTHPIIISAIVVVTIAVILSIIYLILRYRRKKKMKKKLQYIKLLEQ
ncbi:rifin [Plasmodium reichenowi]|uniref:Rifin n=1 Tax=Plasmodium reichenowi TaxID=5854 RepID=A0A060RM00_PLARE|nr:rifin [Plasmodium reichenowi]